jgi:hypothetical protein
MKITYDMNIRVGGPEGFAVTNCPLQISFSTLLQKHKYASFAV